MRVMTSDVFCGAFLLARGGRLVDLLVDRSGRRHAGTFVFEGEDLLAYQQEYSTGEAVATVKAIREGVTLLRGRLARALDRPGDRARHPECR
jgi:hypothetical protein